MLDILKNKYEIVLRDNYLNIKNYKSIIEINSNLIKVIISDSSIFIKGENLIITCLDECEMVIKGKVYSIEFINEQS